MKAYKVSEALKGKYRILIHLPRLYNPIVGWVDFRTITVEQADELVAAGSAYIVKLKVKNADV